MGYVLALWGEFVKFTGGRAGLVHLLLFAAALVCCFFLGKEERHRLFWPSVLVGIFFFNPVFYKYVGTRFLSGVYWRLLWMLPWTPTPRESRPPVRMRRIRMRRPELP